MGAVRLHRTPGRMDPGWRCPPGTAGLESCFRKFTPRWPRGASPGVKGAGRRWPGPSSLCFVRFPPLAVRVGLPPSRPPRGGTLCRLPPLVVGCPYSWWASLFRLSPPSSAPSPGFGYPVGRACSLVGLGFGLIIWSPGPSCGLALPSGSRLPSVCAPSALRGCARPQLFSGGQLVLLPVHLERPQGCKK